MASFDPSEHLDAFAHEAITVAGTAIGFTAATWGNPSSGHAARMALVNVETAPIRWLATGDPTASTGHPLAAGAQISIYGTADLTSMRFIREGGSSATLRVTYYR